MSSIRARYVTHLMWLNGGNSNWKQCKMFILMIETKILSIYCSKWFDNFVSLLKQTWYMQSIVIQSLIVIVWFELDLPKMNNKKPPLTSSITTLRWVKAFWLDELVTWLPKSYWSALFHAEIFTTSAPDLTAPRVKPK